MATIIELEPLTETQLPEIEPWFDDPESRTWLGGPGWAETSYKLADPNNGRHILTTKLNSVPVGLLDIECTSDGDASFAVVVDPCQRQQGIAVRAIRAMFEYPSFCEVRRFWGGVEDGNVASEALLARCGFTRAEHQTEEGFVDYEIRR